MILNEKVRLNDRSIDRMNKVFRDIRSKGKEYYIKNKKKKNLKNFDVLMNIIKKEFNIEGDYSLMIDEQNSDIDFGMAVQIALDPESYVKLEERKVDKSGENFKLKEIKNAMFYFDGNTIFRDDLNERHMTACLLHEVGHVVYYNHYFDKYKNFGGMVFSWLASIPLAMAFPPLLIFTGTMIFLSNQYKKSIDKDFEKVSDSLATRYGYGVEINEVLNLMRKSLEKRSNKEKNVALKLFQKISLLKFKSLNKKRKEEMVNILKEEADNPDLDKKEKDYINRQIRKIEKM